MHPNEVMIDRAMDAELLASQMSRARFETVTAINAIASRWLDTAEAMVDAGETGRATDLIRFADEVLAVTTGTKGPAITDPAFSATEPVPKEYHGMLCLDRKDGERIVIELLSGQEIEVVLVKGRQGRARLGFDAPKEIQIRRKELPTSRAAAADGPETESRCQHEAGAKESPGTVR